MNVNKRRVEYVGVSVDEITSMGELGILFQVFYGLFTTALGAFIAALIGYLSDKDNFSFGMTVVFWVSIILTVVLGLMTVLVYRSAKKAQNSIVPKSTKKSR